MTKTKKQDKNNRLPLYIGIVATIIVTMSLFHAPFKRYSKEYLSHKKKYKVIVKKRNRVQDSLLKELGETLTIAQYKKLRVEYWNKSQKELQEYTKVKNELINSWKFLGRKNFKFWFFLFALVTLSFYFSLYSLINDFKRSNGHYYISTIGLSISLFWYYHLFFQKADDFYVTTYGIYQIAFSVLGGFFINRLIQYYSTKKGTIRLFIELLVRIKKTHYPKVVAHARYAEKHDKSIDSIHTVKDFAEEFDLDIKETIEKVDSLNNPIS